MHTIKVNGNPVAIPTDCKEPGFTLKHFFALRDCKDVIDEISVLTGIGRNTIDNFKDLRSIEAAVALCNTLGASIKRGFDGTTLPKTILLGGKFIDVPRDLSIQPIGAFMSVSNLLAGRVNKMQKDNPDLKVTDIDFTDCIPQTLAYYFYHLFYGDAVLYSDERAEDPRYLDLIMQLPFVQAVPIGNFFFRRFPNLT